MRNRFTIKIYDRLHKRATQFDFSSYNLDLKRQLSTVAVFGGSPVEIVDGPAEATIKFSNYRYREIAYPGKRKSRKPKKRLTRSARSL